MEISVLSPTRAARIRALFARIQAGTNVGSQAVELRIEASLSRHAVTHFRLTTLSDPKGRTFDLTPGANIVGSDSRLSVCLAGRGVSRRHAVIHVDVEDCRLEDQGSKNGSTINGKPVVSGDLKSGDVVGFGAARCVLEAIHRDDLELAVAVDWSTRAKVTTLLGQGSADDGDEGTVDGMVLGFVSDLMDRLRLVPADLEGAMVDLARRMKARGVCLGEWPDQGPVRIIAAAGELGPLPSHEEILAAPTFSDVPELRGLRPAEDCRLTARVADSGDEVLALTVFGAPEDSPAKLPALALLLLGQWTQEEAELKPSAAAGRGLKLPDGIVAGTSKAMADIYRQIEMVAADGVPVLILGETGVGKEHLARALHDHSSRASGPFVAINCAAIPAELLEAELFGIGKGVATGVSRRQGQLLAANGGTVFLDEIGDMPMGLQAKLLRTLQEGEITPLGEAPVRLDVRWVSATHNDLAASIAEKTFRQDLYYRLGGYELRVPPLRRRREDLPILVGFFIKLFGRQLKRNVKGITVKALRGLAQHPWPGNVRELRHVIRRLVYLCPPGQAIDSRHVGEALEGAGTTATDGPASFELGVQGLDEFLAGHERRIVQKALEHTQGNQSQAARLLKISRNGLARRLERLGLNADANKAAPDDG